MSEEDIEILSLYEDKMQDELISLCNQIKEIHIGAYIKYDYEHLIPHFIEIASRYKKAIVGVK